VLTPTEIAANYTAEPDRAYQTGNATEYSCRSALHRLLEAVLNYRRVIYVLRETMAVMGEI